MNSNRFPEKSTHFANQLHVTIFNTIVNHLDIVTGTLITNPVAACLTITLCSNTLENIFDERPCLFITTRHQTGSIPSSFFSTRYTSADESNFFPSEVLGSTVGIREMRVATINDDVSRLDMR